MLHCSNPEYTLIANGWNGPTPPVVALIYFEVEDGKAVQKEASAACEARQANGTYACPIEIRPVVGYLANLVPDREGTYFAVLDPINIANKTADGSIQFQLDCEEW